MRNECKQTWLYHVLDYKAPKGTALVYYNHKSRKKYEIQTTCSFLLYLLRTFLEGCFLVGLCSESDSILFLFALVSCIPSSVSILWCVISSNSDTSVCNSFFSSTGSITCTSSSDSSFVCSSLPSPSSSYSSASFAS